MRNNSNQFAGACGPIITSCRVYCGSTFHSSDQGDVTEGSLDIKATGIALKDLPRLIAAAPELLEALQACLPDLEHYAATHGPGPDQRLIVARGAIRKATGNP